MNIEEVKALVGQTFGSGKNQRTVTRIEDLGETTGWGDNRFLAGNVYWKRPGGKERKQPQWLPYFVQWLAKAERDANRTVVSSIEEVELYLSEFPGAMKLEGFINRKDDEVTIVFKIK